MSRGVAWMGDGAVVGAKAALKASGRVERDLLNVLLILEVDDGRGQKSREGAQRRLSRDREKEIVAERENERFGHGLIISAPARWLTWVGSGLGVAGGCMTGPKILS